MTTINTINNVTILAERLLEIKEHYRLDAIKKYGPDCLGSKPINDDYIETVVEKVVDDMNDTKDIYNVYNAGMEGRDCNNIEYVKAFGTKHARLIVAVERENAEIFETGYYGANVTKEETIQEKVEKLKRELAKLENVL